MNKRILGIAVAVVLACLMVFLYQKYRVAPDFRLEGLQLSTLEGETVSLRELEGKKLFVNFFATWCQPCMKEMALLQDAQLQMGDEMVFICISAEPVELLKRFAERKGAHLMVLHSDQPLKTYGIHTLPTTYILNSHHAVEYSSTGVSEWNSPAMIEEMSAYE